MMIKASHSSRMTKELRGFGNLSLLVCEDCCCDPSASVCLSSDCVCLFDHHWITDLRHHSFGTARPSPTILRAVSGIEPEDTAPAEEFGQKTTDNRAQRRRNHNTCSHRPDIFPTLCCCRNVRYNTISKGHGAAAPCALETAEDNQRRETVL
ncbi:unnamed protein product [Penicillium roqueforti FM164]|uniref:Uncharacterized protein n=1 Tax=Penicillium roqueforti (strain FM164) TaxID=1365484 RepID=W6QRE8_PENRF|nr:unnamed protein product [Penicillium roqueforti FM164]